MQKISVFNNFDMIESDIPVMIRIIKIIYLNNCVILLHHCSCVDMQVALML